MNPIQHYFLHNGILTPEAFAKIEQKVRAEKISIMHAIEALELLPVDQILQIFSRYYRAPIANLSAMDVPRSIIDLIPKDLAIKHRVVPIDRAGNNIILAMGDPRNLDAVDAIRFSVGFFPKPVLASELQLTDALEKYYGRVLDINQIQKEKSTTKTTRVSRERQDIAAATGGDGPIIKLVNQILIQCLHRRASDIHIEPYESFLRVRLRIDGVLHEIARPPISMKAPLISRIKIMSDMDIAETRLPQDGAINIFIGSKAVDFRVSSLPTVYGEKIVLRILDKSALKVDMTELGFDKDELEKFITSIKNPYGMVLVTGPTGSGKTTSLYSALSELNKEADNIMTAEDPVEYNLEGINQVQMKSEIGLDFASALRAFLRQDPDIIMVGEIRDLETAEIAIKAALTGHMVLSTLHTNSAPDTISRLMNMGVESFNLVAALTCITAQRLMRRLCDNCRVEDEAITPKHMIDLGIHPDYSKKVKAYIGQGCRKCGGTGFLGRVAVHEVLKLTDPVREAILRGAPSLEIKRVAMSSGMRTLRQSALNKMVKGQASVYEVTKVTASDNDDSDESSNNNAA